MTDDGVADGTDERRTDVASLARDLRAEARRANERRLLVLAGDREAGYDAVRTALDAADVPRAESTLVGPRDALGCERVGQRRADRLLGRTRTAVVLDAHDALFPNALGRVVGAVDGGGLLVVLAPPLDAWPDRRDDFDATLAVPPADVDDVTGHFRRRLVDSLRAHPGIAIVDVDGGTSDAGGEAADAVGGVVDVGGCIVERDGLTDPPPRRPSREPTPPEDARFPAAAYEACLTADQAEAVAALEALSDDDHAVVVEADRGRGKSSAAGIAAGALAAAGEDVLVTAPEYAAAREVFVRARALLDSLDALADGAGGEDDGDRGGDGDREGDPRVGERDRAVRAASGGVVRFAPPPAAAEAVEAGTDGASEGVRSHASSNDPSRADTHDAPDVVIVDEAAALPVRLLARLLAARRVAFATTVHGYEGAGRGFSVRFRDHLADGDLAVTDVRIDEPIRYAPGDPVEVWAFRALLLDAGPAADQLVAGATPGDAVYRGLPAAELVADEHLLGEAFGLLVAAHYRTEPADLARLLDAPNVTVRALLRDGHVVSVALLAREGGLPADVRAHMYEGGRVRGNMLPDVLTGQLRDEAAGVPVGMRVLRIATHHAVRSRGLGSHLLARVREEFAGGGEGDAIAGEEGDAVVSTDGADDSPNAGVDWLGTGYGATPELLSFWAANGYGTVHLSTTRNAASGEHSALMLSPTSEAGRDLHDRHARWFVRRVASMLSDPLSEVEPDVVRAALRTVDVTPSADGGLALDLDARDWRVVADAAYGPGLFDAAPRPFRKLVVRYLVDSGAGVDGSEVGADGSEDGDDSDDPLLTPREERLLVAKVLQAHGWDRVADALGYHSRGQCMRALGEALQPLVDRYGDETAMASRDRFAGEE